MKNYKRTIRSFEKSYDKKSTRKLSGLKKHFSSKEEVKKILKKKDPVVYEVFIKKIPPISLGLTVINPGSIKKEFYFTAGHIHKGKTPEFYILLEGQAKLLIQKGKPKTIDMKRGKISLIPEGYAHRLVNTGNKKLKVLTIYHEDSKPSYNVKFKRRFFRK